MRLAPYTRWAIPLLLAACEHSATKREREGDAGAEAAAELGLSLSWQRMRAPIAADGTTEPLRFTLSAPANVFALRTYPAAPPGGLSCFALRDVVVNDADTWVGADTAAESGAFCSACLQHRSPRRRECH
ncbi:MAG TPA: hypothetical protein VFN67_07545 [Polyangiales bacterium]|nr:hypothetical protein [Polyangiales bacterium]